MTNDTQELLGLLQKADYICKQANEHLMKAGQYDKQADIIEEEKKKEEKVVRGVMAVALFCVASFLVKRINDFLALLLVLCMTTGVVYVITKLREARKLSVQEQKEKANRERMAAQKVFDDNMDGLSFLPDEYWYPLATDYLVKMVATNRANTLAEVLNLYDEQLHRWRIEEAYDKMHEQQRAQYELLRSVKTNSRIGAAASVANAAFNIASRL